MNKILGFTYFTAKIKQITVNTLETDMILCGMLDFQHLTLGGHGALFVSKLLHILTGRGLLYLATWFTTVSLDYVL